MTDETLEMTEQTKSNNLPFLFAMIVSGNRNGGEDICRR